MKIFKWLIIPMVLLLCLTGCQIGPSDYKSNVEEKDYHEIKYDGKDYSYNTSLTNILVIGIDNPELKGQADFLGLFIVDRDNKKISFLNLPRETKIEVELWDEAEYLGTSNAYLNMVYPFSEYQETGAKATMSKVSEILNGVPVIDYFVTSTEVFTYLNRMFGDFTITLQDDSLSYLNEEWVAGYPMLMTAENTKIFLQNRDTNENNSAERRRSRQNLYLQTIEDRIKEIDESAVVDLFEKSMTNLTLEQIEAYADGTYQMGEFYHLPGKYLSSEYYDEYEINESERDKFVVETFYKD